MALPLTLSFPPDSDTLPVRSTGRVVASGVGVKAPYASGTALWSGCGQSAAAPVEEA